MTKLSVDGAFDIETQDWDVFVTGGLLLADGRVFKSRDEDAFFARLMECRGTIWTWGGGRYDMIWLASQCALRGIRADVSLAGARITRLAIRGGPAFRDGFALFPVKLAKAAPICGLEKDETGLDCECGKECGGYCAIRRDMSDANYARVEQYMEGDLLCTLGVVEYLWQHALDEGILLKGTVGASAWATAKVRGELPEAKWQSEMYRFARLGYYGGRTEVYRLRADKVVLHDLNSAYPWSLTTTAVPIGEPRFAADPTKAWDSGKPGVYEALVNVPPCEYPPLPMRLPGRIVFPHGRFSGVWTQTELRRAVELGARVERVRRALVWPDAAPVLAEFCSWGWKRRNEAGKESTLGGWWKWFLNSLTGKLAMAPESESLKVAPEPEDVKRCPGGQWCFGVLCGTTGQCCDHRACTGKCGRWEMVDRAGLLWAAPKWEIHECGHVQWAAYLTANARMELNSQQRHAGDSLVYSDTDSCYTTQRLTRRIGEDLGQWNVEGTGLDWRSDAPKMYAYRLVEKKGRPIDKQIIKSKGINSLKTREQYDAWIAGEPAIDERGVESLKVAARVGDTAGDWFAKRVIKRTNRQFGRMVGGRLRDGERTIACDATEIQLLLAHDQEERRKKDSK